MTNRLQDRLDKLQKQLDERNEATKVWIQAETQARAYVIQLEKEIARKDEALRRIADEDWPEDEIRPDSVALIVWQIKIARKGLADKAQP